MYNTTVHKKETNIALKITKKKYSQCKTWYPTQTSQKKEEIHNRPSKGMMNRNIKNTWDNRYRKKKIIKTYVIP